MVDRIEKIKSSDYWKLQEAQKSKKDKQDQSSEGEKEGHSSFEEKIDLEHLLPKTPGKIGTLFGNESRLKASLSTPPRTQAKIETESPPSPTEFETTLIRRFPKKFLDKFKSLMKVQTALYLAILILLLISVYFIFRILMK